MGGRTGTTRIHVHPYLSVNGVELSKSSGVTLHPGTLAKGYGTDALRCSIARDVQANTDTDFTASASSPRRRRRTRETCEYPPTRRCRRSSTLVTVVAQIG